MSDTLDDFMGLELDARLGLATRCLQPMILHLAHADAKRWCLKNLRSTMACPLSSFGLKGQWAATTDRHLTQSQFFAVLAECGFAAEGATFEDESNVRAEIIGW